MAAPQTKNLHIYTIWSVDNGGNGRAGARATEQPIVFSFIRAPDISISPKCFTCTPIETKPKMRSVSDGIK